MKDALVWNTSFKNIRICEHVLLQKGGCLTFEVNTNTNYTKCNGIWVAYLHSICHFNKKKDYHFGYC